MKISYQWLKEYVDLKISAEKLADAISLKTAEVESVENLGEEFKNIVVGEIVDIKKHPHADKLQITKVKVGKGEPLNIICGAKNIQTGQKVPVALPGTALPNGLVIEKTEIRGIVSEGMLASAKELGISDDHEGIMILEDSSKIGDSLEDTLKLKDTVLDLDILPNRPDLLSYRGVAREVSAILGVKTKLNDPNVKEDAVKKIDDFISIGVQDFKLCPRYTARVMLNIKISESPQWLKNRLLASGIKPKNNVVDVTNYVMLEFGQPLHAFDLDKIKTKKITIRKARPKEKIKTLDGEERTLSPEIIIITDSKNPIAVGGVIGGEETEIGVDTKNVLIEAATFNWVNIRKAERILGIRTDASERFEKNLDPQGTRIAADRACEIISEIAGGQVAQGSIDEKTEEIFEKRKIKFNINNIRETIGIDVSPAKITTILKSLGLELEQSKTEMIVDVPSFRRDINIPEDISEEIVRIYGYDKVPTTLPRGEFGAPKSNESVSLEKKVKNILSGSGMTEVYTYSFIGEDLLGKFGKTAKGYLELANPLSSDCVFLRQSLVPSVADVIARNSRNFDKISVFEIASVYTPSSKNKAFPLESKKLVLGVAGNDQKIFYFLKGYLEMLSGKLNIDLSYAIPQKAPDFMHPVRTAEIFSDKKSLGIIGEIHPEVLNNLGASKRIAIAQIDLDILLQFVSEGKEYQAIPKYPSVMMDIAFVVDRKVLERDITDTIKNTDKELIKNVERFDVYEGPKIGDGKKSLAYHVTYQSDKKTLTDKEALGAQQKVIQTLSGKFKAEMRDS